MSGDKYGRIDINGSFSPMRKRYIKEISVETGGTSNWDTIMGKDVVYHIDRGQNPMAVKIYDLITRELLYSGDTGRDTITANMVVDGNGVLYFIVQTYTHSIYVNANEIRMVKHEIVIMDKYGNKKVVGGVDDSNLYRTGSLNSLYNPSLYPIEDGVVYHVQPSNYYLPSNADVGYVGWHACTDDNGDIYKTVDEHMRGHMKIIKSDGTYINGLDHLTSLFTRSSIDANNKWGLDDPHITLEVLNSYSTTDDNYYYYIAENKIRYYHDILYVGGYIKQQMFAKVDLNTGNYTVNEVMSEFFHDYEDDGKVEIPSYVGRLLMRPDGNIAFMNYNDSYELLSPEGSKMTDIPLPGGVSSIFPCFYNNDIIYTSGTELVRLSQDGSIIQKTTIREGLEGRGCLIIDDKVLVLTATPSGSDTSPHIYRLDDFSFLYELTYVFTLSGSVYDYRCDLPRYANGGFATVERTSPEGVVYHELYYRGNDVMLLTDGEYVYGDIVNELGEVLNNSYDYDVTAYLKNSDGVYISLSEYDENGDFFELNVDPTGYYSLHIDKRWNVSRDNIFFDTTAIYRESERKMFSSVINQRYDMILASMPGNTYEVWTPEDLISIGTTNRDMLGNFIQMADIDMTGYDFSGIGLNSPIYRVPEDPFGGTYDGNGFSISNLSIRMKDDHSIYYGLFNHCMSMDSNHVLTFKNINIKNVIIEDTMSSDAFVNSVGSIFGNAEGYINIDNCNVSGFKIHCNKNISVGGLAGGLENWSDLSYEYGTFSLTNCHISGLDIVVPYASGSVAGLSAYLYLDNYGHSIKKYLKIENCHARGDLYGGSGVAGFITHMYIYEYKGYPLEVVFNKNSFKGNLKSERATAGAVVNFYIDLYDPNSLMEFKNSYFQGSVTETGSGVYSGGFFSYGYLWGNAHLKKCYIAMELDITSGDGGILAEEFWVYDNPDVVIQDLFYDSNLAEKYTPSLPKILYGDLTTAQLDEFKGKTTEEMKTQSTFDTWNFTDLWVMNGYPEFTAGWTWVTAIDTEGYKLKDEVFSMTAEEWNGFTESINTARSKNGLSAYTFTKAVKNEAFTAVMFNEAVVSLSDMVTLTFGERKKGDNILASYFNEMMDKVNAL